MQIFSLRQQAIAAKPVPGRGLPKVMTSGASEAFSPNEIQESMRRFESADWGAVAPADAQSNQTRLADQGEQAFLMGVYHFRGKTLWIICDGAAVTALLPDEY
jgi:hypothetical protein